MAQNLYLELSGGAVDRIRGLMDHYGESSPEDMILRGLGLLEALQPYIEGDHIIVVDPHADGSDDHVELTFPGLQSRGDKKAAA